MTDQLSASDRDLYELDVIDDAIPFEIRDYSTVQALLDEHETLTHEVAQMAATLKEKQERLKGIVELSLPDAVRDFDVKAKSMTMEDGTVIALEDKCHVSVAVADRGRAYAWLDENGHGGLLKWTYTIEFGKNEGAQAKAFQRMVANLFPDREISVVLGRTPTELGNALVKVMESAFPAHKLECETTVAPNSLTALIKKIRHKVTLPPEIKVFAPTVATITRPVSMEIEEDIFGEAPKTPEQMVRRILEDAFPIVPNSADPVFKKDIVGEFIENPGGQTQTLAAPLAAQEPDPKIVLTPKQLQNAAEKADAPF